MKNRKLVLRKSHEFVWILIDFCGNKVSYKLSFSVSVVMVLLDINKISPKGGKTLDTVYPEPNANTIDTLVMPPTPSVLTLKAGAI